MPSTRYRTKIANDYEAHLISKARNEMAIRPHGSDDDYTIVPADEFLDKNEPVPEATPKGRDFRREVKKADKANLVDLGFGFKSDGTPRQRRAKQNPASQSSNGHQTTPAILTPSSYDEAPVEESVAV